MEGPGGTEPRILFCSDFLMNSEQEQALHFRWLPLLFKHPIQWACHCPLHQFGGIGSGADIEFDRARFFSLSGAANFDQRAKLSPFTSADIVQASTDYLRSFISPEDLLVGYELSDSTREVLNKADITYIDLWLHPVRFYDDVMFAFSSNHRSIQPALHEYELDARLLELSAAELTTAVSRGVWPKAKVHSERTALFVGQTGYDKALLSGQNMLRLEDFKADFEALTQAYDCVLYSRHPMVHAGDGRTRSYLRRFNNVMLSDAPTYHLLAEPKVKGVYSISSSVVHEARYFNKQIGYFYRPPVQLCSMGQSGNYVTVFESFMTPQFWQRILVGHLTTRDPKPLQLTPKANRLRDTLGLVYGYQHIDKLEDLRRRLWWARDLRGTAARRLASIFRSWRNQR